MGPGGLSDPTTILYSCFSFMNLAILSRGAPSYLHPLVRRRGGRCLPLELRGDLRWGLGEGFENIETVFSGRRDDGPDVGEYLRTVKCTEGAQDFRAQLHPTQVLFGLIVGEEDCAPLTTLFQPWLLIDSN